MKTDKQTVLELQRSKVIEDIIRDSLEKTRGEKFQITLAALDLGVTDATFYSWCRDLGINIDEYRHPAPADVGGGGE